MRILVIEDDADKLRRVLQAIQEVPDLTLDHVVVARDAIEGKTKLRQVRFDLMILDLAIPERSDQVPTPLGGISLLDEVMERDIYLRPREIVGLTAYEEVRDTAAPRFAEDLWDVVFYDHSAEDWKVFIQRKLRHLQLANAVTDEIEYGVDLCIVTALPSLELQAVLNLDWHWSIKPSPGDGTVYHHGSYVSDGKSRKVVACATPGMGMTAAAVTATKMIYTFRPRYLAMVGILAGIRGANEFGDIIVADAVWDWGSGKHLVDGGSPIFSVAPRQIPISSYVRGKLILMANSSEVFDEIRRSWQADCPKTNLRMHIGPVASGASVLADQQVVRSIREHNRKLLGVEMELYGVYGAVDESPLPQPKVIGMKSVCDFGDEVKDDRYQRYAAYTSAQALRILMERFVV